MEQWKEPGYFFYSLVVYVCIRELFAVPQLCYAIKSLLICLESGYYV